MEIRTLERADLPAAKAALQSAFPRDNTQTGMSEWELAEVLLDPALWGRTSGKLVYCDAFYDEAGNLI